MLDTTLLLAPQPKALAIYETLTALSPAISISIGQWIDCATRLDIAASDAHFAGQAGHHRKLRDRADDCRARARRLVVVEVRS